MSPPWQGRSFAPRKTARGHVHGFLLACIKALVAAARLIMEWIAGIGRRVAGSDAQSSSVQKLRGYHELAQVRMGP